MVYMVYNRPVYSQSINDQFGATEINISLAFSVEKRSNRSCSQTYLISEIKTKDT